MVDIPLGLRNSIETQNCVLFIGLVLAATSNRHRHAMKDCSSSHFVNGGSCLKRFLEEIIQDHIEPFGMLVRPEVRRSGHDEKEALRDIPEDLNGMFKLDGIAITRHNKKWNVDSF